MSDQDYDYIKVGELENRPVFVDRITGGELFKISKKLFDLNKKEQTEILKNEGETKIPKLEKDRVNKIIELQGGDK